jgi:Spy/CpxP family protein refolding chaperone
MTTVLAAALVLAALPVVTLAQPAAPAHDCGGCGKSGSEMGKGPGRGLSGLALTAEQSQKLEGLRVEQVKATAGPRAEIEAKQVELAALWRAEKLDSKKIIATVRAIAGLREKLAVARANHRLAVDGLLTPEQRVQFRAGAGEGGRRGKGMMRGKGTGRGMMRGKGEPGGCRGECGDCQQHTPAPGKK